MDQVHLMKQQIFYKSSRCKKCVTFKLRQEFWEWTTADRGTGCNVTAFQGWDTWNFNPGKSFLAHLRGKEMLPYCVNLGKEWLIPSRFANWSCLNMNLHKSILIHLPGLRIPNWSRPSHKYYKNQNGMQAVHKSSHHNNGNATRLRHRCPAQRNKTKNSAPFVAIHKRQRKKDLCARHGKVSDTALTLLAHKEQVEWSSQSLFMWTYEVVWQKTTGRQANSPSAVFELHGWAANFTLQKWVCKLFTADSTRKIKWAPRQPEAHKGWDPSTGISQLAPCS